MQGTGLFDTLQNNIVLLVYGKDSVVIWMKNTRNFSCECFLYDFMQFHVLCPDTYPTLNIPYLQSGTELQFRVWKVKAYVIYPTYIWRNRCAYACRHTKANTLLHISTPVIITALISYWIMFAVFEDLSGEAGTLRTEVL
jgi:hypothetical protein